jgi:endonuclease I
MNRQRIRNFVMDLQGPPCSYCTCNVLCSNRTVDHVVPKDYIYKNLKKRNLLHEAINDPHNIYRVCDRKNAEKGSSLLSNKLAGDEFSGLKARSYLYMHAHYNLFDEYFLSDLKSISLLHRPFPFEIRRSREISQYIGHINTFVEYFPLTIGIGQKH